MKKVLKWGGIALIALIVLALIVPKKSKESTAETNQTLSDSKEAATWVTVQTIDGNGKKQSPTFHLNGGEQKIVYKYKSNMDEVGVFSVYVENKGHDFENEGGLPVVMSSQPNESSESYLNKSEGDYYVMVNAAGRYTVELQEKK